MHFNLHGKINVSGHSASNLHTYAPRSHSPAVNVIMNKPVHQPIVMPTFQHSFPTFQPTPSVSVVQPTKSYKQTTIVTPLSHRHVSPKRVSQDEILFFTQIITLFMFLLSFLNFSKKNAKKIPATTSKEPKIDVAVTTIKKSNEAPIPEPVKATTVKVEVVSQPTITPKAENKAKEVEPKAAVTPKNDSSSIVIYNIKIDHTVNNNFAAPTSTSKASNVVNQPTPEGWPPGYEQKPSPVIPPVVETPKTIPAGWPPGHVQAPSQTKVVVQPYTVYPEGYPPQTVNVVNF